MMCPVHFNTIHNVITYDQACVEAAAAEFYFRCRKECREDACWKACSCMHAKLVHVVCPSGPACHCGVSLSRQDMASRACSACCSSNQTTPRTILVSATHTPFSHCIRPHSPNSLSKCHAFQHIMKSLEYAINHTARLSS